MAAAAAAAEPPERVEVPEGGDLGPLGGRIAARLGPGDVVWLEGDLGVGKTALVGACARALGVIEPITSPTYPLVHRYAGRHPVVHLDLHRLAGAAPEDVRDVVAELDAEAVGFVEWPEHGRGALPAPTLVVGIDLAPDGTRAFRLAWGRSSGSGPLP